MHSDTKDTLPDTMPDMAPLLNPVLGCAGEGIVGIGDALEAVAAALDNVVDPLR